MYSSSYLIISDIHNRTTALDEVQKRQVRRPDALLFCGDGLRSLSYLSENVNLFAVGGNWDSFRRLTYPSGFTEDVPDERVINLDGKRILMMHGHTRGVKYSLTSAIYAAREVDADALIFGHTHTREHFRIDGNPAEKALEVFNPGSLLEGDFGTLEIRNGVMLFSHGKI